MVAAGVFVGAAKAVRVRPAAKVPTAWVRISSGLTVTVGVMSAGVAPQALSSTAPIIKICIPTINRNLSILTPFHKRRYFTWIFVFVQPKLDKAGEISCRTDHKKTGDSSHTAP